MQIEFSQVRSGWKPIHWAWRMSAKQIHDCCRDILQASNPYALLPPSACRKRTVTHAVDVEVLTQARKPSTGEAWAKGPMEGGGRLAGSVGDQMDYHSTPSARAAMPRARPYIRNSALRTAPVLHGIGIEKTSNDWRASGRLFRRLNRAAAQAELQLPEPHQAKKKADVIHASLFSFPAFESTGRG